MDFEFNMHFDVKMWANLMTIPSQANYMYKDYTDYATPES